MGSSLLRMVITVALIYVSYAALCYFAQRLIIYPGRAIRVPAATDLPKAGITRVWLETRFGRSEAWFLPARPVAPVPGPVVLFFHGNGEIIDYLPEQMEGLRGLGMAVLLVEYPGYGRSTGNPSEESITAAATAAYDAMTKRIDVDRSRIIAFGRSLGSGAACALSRQRPLAALVLQSPMSSTRPFARRFFLPGFLVRDAYDNRLALEAFQGPVLIMHGRRDDVIPFAQGEELARVSRNATFVELACAHNDCPPDWQEFWRRISGFLKEHGVVADRTDRQTAEDAFQGAGNPGETTDFA